MLAVHACSVAYVPMVQYQNQPEINDEIGPIALVCQRCERSEPDRHGAGRLHRHPGERRGHLRRHATTVMPSRLGWHATQLHVPIRDYRHATKLYSYSTDK
jgi:hypothetical protein